MKKFLSFFLAMVMSVCIVPQAALADVQTREVNVSAQSGGYFLCAPQEMTAVRSDAAERYGFSDSVEDGVSVADVLVSLHEDMFGEDFAENTADYLQINGGWVSCIFGVPTYASGWILNGAYAIDKDDDTLYSWGYMGSTVDTQKVEDGDTVEFFIYQDDVEYTDRIAWFDYVGKDVEEIAVQPGAKVNLTLSAIGYGSACYYKNIQELHAAGSAVSGARIAFVDKDTGACEDITEAVTDSDGKISFTAPEKEGEYYITAYIPEGGTGAPLIMSLTKLVADKTVEAAGICDLGTLSVETLRSQPNPLDITPSFDRNVTEYLTAAVDYEDSSVWRSLYVTAASANTDAKITAECNGVSKDITVSSNRVMLLGALEAGKNNILTVTVSADGEKKVYTVKVPMKPEKNTAPFALVETMSESIALGEAYSADLAELFYEADETDTLSYTVSVNGAEPEKTDAEYTFVPETAGRYVLVFAANDGSDVSGNCTVSLNVSDSGTTLPEEEKRAQILTAETNRGDWYPTAFDGGRYTYCIVVPAETDEEPLTYTVPEGATVKIANAEQTPDAEGKYKTVLSAENTLITVTSEDKRTQNTYSFKLQKKIPLYPDKVTDYLCINSRYTNGVGAGNAAAPWESLSGKYVSIGNFGGYITYYYENALTDNPNNRYGVDFYVYGNALKDTSTASGTSFFEPAQAWVSEDGETWYALAGSAHYDEGVCRDYSVTYKKNENGKTSWTDNLGNENSDEAYSGDFPSSDVYCMNSLAASESITLSGILLPADTGDAAAVGNVSAYPVKWGYADCFANADKGAEVNPYEDNTDFDLPINGFDLKWAVDRDGIPIDVSDKEFHYVKLVSASNIWTPNGEKSPEIAGMALSVADDKPVGVTADPKGITITDGVDKKYISFREGQRVYSVDAGDMKYVSVAVDGAAEDDNVYINNKRVPCGGSADGIKITREAGEKLVRILVQNGEKEPQIYILKLTGTASESGDLIEGIKLNVNGSTRTASTTDGKTYTSEVGYRMESVEICSICGNDVTVTVNGEEPKESYSLNPGENIFTVSGKRGGEEFSVVLKIIKDAAPESDGQIEVYFTLLGDTVHGETGEKHTLKGGNLTSWINSTRIVTDSPATVSDIFEKALSGKYEFVNEGGNYISGINGLREFDNGPNSGWSYTLNGSYNVKGVAEQTVRDGDTIVFHYTDDYTLEKYDVTWDTEYTDDSIEQGTSSASKNDSKPAVSEKVEENTASECPFSDVTGHWGYEAIKYVYDKSLMQGVTEESFAPDNKMTRAMVVTVIYRMAGEEEPIGENRFSDVADDAWYKDAVVWAAQNGIVSGVSEDRFAPENFVTREQLAVLMWRYAKMKGYEMEQTADISDFADSDRISDWAAEAVCRMYSAGIIEGTGENMFSPDSFATRAQTAAIIMRFCNLYE